MNIIKNQSPNYTNKSYIKNAVILHTSLGTFDGGVSWILNPQSRVSYHYLISRDGEIVELVHPGKVAWHSGNVHAPNDKGKRILKKNNLGQYVNPNTHTIGVAFANTERQSITEDQIETCVELLQYLDERFKLNLTKNNLVTHRDITSYKPNIDSWMTKIQARLFGSSFADKHRGKIFINVEGKGEAWWVNPKDLKRYYLGKPAHALKVFKKHGIGITKKNLLRIPKA